ncbi:hypothetical protein FRB99_008630, partial [Tulasnella sp. 403]
DTLDLDTLRIKLADLSYDQSCRLGSGRFGTVYKAILRGVLGDDAGEVVAVKDLFPTFDEAAKIRFKDDLRSLSTLKNPNIVQFRGFCEEEEKILLVLPYHSTGTLAAYLEKESLPYSGRLELATGTAQGLLYLHTRDPPICHGSIHLNNILMDVHGKPLLSDYGLAAALDTTAGVRTFGAEGLFRYECPEKPSTVLPAYRISWDIAGNTVRNCARPLTNVGGLAFSHDGHYFAMVCGKVTQIIDTDTWQVSTELASPGGSVGCPSFSRSGHSLAAGDNNGTVRVWDLRSRESRTFSCPGPSTSLVWDVDISADDMFVAAASEDGKVYLWQTDSKQEGRILVSNTTREALAVAISPRCDLVAAGFDSNQDVLIWDLQTGTLLSSLAGSWVRYIQFSPDGAWLYWCNDDDVRRWELDVTKTDITQPAVFEIDYQRWFSLSISPDNAWFATISSINGDVHIGQSSKLDSAKRSIGKVPASDIWHYVALGPMTNSATGLAAGYGGRDADAVSVYYKIRLQKMPSALVLIANGTEEMEFEKADAHPTPSSVAKCSRGVKIIADLDLSDLENPQSFDALIIPGGAKGADTMSNSPAAQQLVKDYYSQGKVVGMVCAGSLAALKAGLPKTTITSHPSVKSQLDQAFEYSENPVVVADNLITRLADTAQNFRSRSSMIISFLI